MPRITTLSIIAIAALAVLVGASTFRDAAEAWPAGPTGFERALVAQESHSDALLSKAGIVGTALGFDENGNAAVQVFTTRAGVSGIPNTLDGVKVQVVVTGELVARAEPIGSSASNEFSIDFPFCSTGTLGGRLVSGGTGYGLSNNHVFANVNGSNGAVPGASDIYAPGLADNGCTTNGADKIGELSAYVPIDFNGGDNLVDAAIALDTGDGLGGDAIGTSTPGGEYTPSSIALPCENDACANLLGWDVQKYGRTTNLTSGTITGVNAIVNINYGKGQKARFVDQLIVGQAGFSDSGDSGSLVVTGDANANPVGLLFAGSSSTTIMNRIDLVFSELASHVVGSTVNGLEVDGTDAQPADGPIDDTAPQTTITSAPSSPSSSTSATFEFISSEAGSSFECSMDGPGFVAGFSGCSSPQDYTDLSDGGEYTFEVRAIDGAGNTDPSPASHTWTVDTSAIPPAGITVIAIDPTSIATGTTELGVEITGTGFVEGATVSFQNGSGPAPTAASDPAVSNGGATITIDVSVKSGGPPRSREWEVVVTNPDGTSDVCSCTLTVTP